jgi:ribose 5-phosphate isomerase A
MTADDDPTAAKRAAGEHAADRVTNGQVVGLGTGSTAAHAISALGDAVEEGLTIRGVPTSFQSRQLAIEAGIDLVDLDEVDGLNVAIDGADQVADGQLIKGGGAAHVREKIVASSATEFHVVVDPRKRSDRLDHPVPVATLPDAGPLVADRLRELGGDPSIRMAARKDGPVVTDDGFVVLDCDFGRIDDPAGLAADCARIPGLIEHGLFVDLATTVHVGTDDGVESYHPTIE